MTQTGTLAPAATAATVALGKCVACSKTYRAATYHSTYAGSCEDCRVGDWTPRIKWSRVRGTVTGRTCDEACKSAKGTECKCSCGGDSHGQAHEMGL